MARRADSRRTQRRPRRRVHVLGDRGGEGRHARARARAGRLGHPDAERVGDRGPARGDGDLDGRLRRASPTATSSCRTAPRWGSATARSSSRASRSTSTRSASVEIVIPGRLTTAYLALRLALGADPAVREQRVRPDPRRGRLRAGRRRPDHPRGPADLRRVGAAQGDRPRRVVAGRDGLAAAARRERRARRPRRPAHRRLRGARRRRSGPVSTTGTRRSSTPSSSGAASTVRPPTGSSRCT